jgi:hypothetical protein
MYGKWIYIPTTNDTQNALDEYTADLQLRLNHDQEFPNGPRQIKPGENYRMVDGRLQPSGPVSVMAIHALLVKVILEHNPNCEFYVEESYPLDLLYPNLSPHSLIFKLNREPLPALTTQVIDADHAFWAKQCQSMLGDWLTPETSVSNMCAFVESVYVQKDWSHFTGDTGFVTNDFAMKSFSKLRVSIASLYQWRLTSRTDAGDKARLRAETDYAFRQAFALCPTSPEAVFRYVNFLLSRNRLNDAILIVRTSRHLDPDNEQLNDLLLHLLDFREQQGKAAAH